MARKRNQTSVPAAPAPANEQSGALYTVPELAARWRVSRHTVVAAMKAGHLQAFRVGARIYRVREAEVLRYEQQHMIGGAA